MHGSLYYSGPFLAESFSNETPLSKINIVKTIKKEDRERTLHL